MRIETDRLIIRPFVAQDLDPFRRLLDIPEAPGWQKEKDRAAGFLNWHISNYRAMDIVHGIVCFGVFDKIGGMCWVL